MKSITLCVLGAFTSAYSFGQVSPNTIEFEITPDFENGTFNGNVTYHNNTNQPIPQNTELSFRWRNITDLQTGTTTTQTAGNFCGEWKVAFSPWSNIAPYGSNNLFAFGDFEGDFRLPAYALDGNGDTIRVVQSDAGFVPDNIANSSPEYSITKKTLWKSPSNLVLGQATGQIWGQTTDAYIPENKKSYALACAHASSTINTYAGAEIVTPSFIFAASLFESKCGCADDLIPNSNSQNPLTHETNTADDGCFQVNNILWSQLTNNFNSNFGNLNRLNTVGGDNFAKSSLAFAYNVIYNFEYFRKVNCFELIDYSKNSIDPYFAEQVIYLSQHSGIFGAFGKLSKILHGSNATSYESSQNIFNDAVTNGDITADQGVNAAGAVKNIQMQLENNTSFQGGFSNQNTQNNWNNNDFVHLGNYNENFSWNEIAAYVNDIAPLYPNLNISSTLSEIQTVFDENQTNGSIPFSELGVVIDAIVYNLPMLNANLGLINDYGDSFCSTKSTVSISACTDDNNVYEVYIDCYGTPPFSFEVRDENNNTIKSITNSSISSHSFVYDLNSHTQSESPYLYINNFQDGDGIESIEIIGHSIELPIQFLTNATAVEKKNKFKIFPNPIYSGKTNEIFFDQAEISEGRISIIESTGKKVFNSTLNNQNQIIIPDLKCGLYIVEVFHENSISNSKLIVR